MPYHAVDRPPVGVHDLHHRDPRTPQHRPGRIVMFNPRNNNSRRPPRQHLVQNPFLAAGFVVGDAYDGLQRRVVEDVADARQNLRKHHVRQARNDDRHEIHPRRRQRARDLVRDIAKVPRRREDLLSRCLADIAPVPKNPADRHLAHARGLRHIAKCQWPLAFPGCVPGHGPRVLPSYAELPKIPGCRYR